MKGILGRKMGMTQVFAKDGKLIPVTVVEVQPNVVTQVKTVATDGYDAIQLGVVDRKEKNTTKAMVGHAKKANTTPKRFFKEIRGVNVSDYTLGSIVGVNIFEAGEIVDVTGTSKGKGFQGVVKRHGFAGVGGSTHGQHDRLRAPGSIGASSWPSRVMKGMKMGGRTGGDKVKMINLQIVKIFPEKNLILVKGSVPGHNGSYLKIERWS